MYRLMMVLSIIWSTASLSQNTAYQSVFKRMYYTKHYVQGKCGENIQRMASALQRQGVSLQGLAVVHIQNKGIGTFGMVNAEYTRESRSGKPFIGERNWYFHAILVDSKGLVYDFDFNTQPTVVGFKKYLFQMFLNEPECRQKKYGEFCGGAKNKMLGYQFTWYRASEVLSKIKKPRPLFEGNMIQSMKWVSGLNR